MGGVSAWRSSREPPHTCDCGWELGTSQLTKLSSFVFLTLAWLTELIMNYWGPPTSFGEACNNMESVELSSLGFYFKKCICFPTLNSNQIEGISADGGGGRRETQNDSAFPIPLAEI